VALGDKGKAARGATEFCAGHGGGKRCTHAECVALGDKGKSAVGATEFCVGHGGGKRCTHAECVALGDKGKGAEGATDFCVGHGGGKRCTHAECVALGDKGKAARGASDFCTEHGGGKRCTHAECVALGDKGKSAAGASDFCKKHGGGKRCMHAECVALGFKGKAAQGATDFCIEHGGGKRCTHAECVALGDKGKAAQGATEFCKGHGGGDRCPNCVDWPDAHSGDAYYDGYCARCFKRVFPSDQRSAVIYEHTKEIRVRNFINEHFAGFTHDQPMWLRGCDCTHKRRVDHRCIIGGTMLAIETDEFAHRGYDQADEALRYDDLFMLFSGKWIFVRFNPDDNRGGKGVDMKDKLERLRAEIKLQIGRIERGENTLLLEVVKLFY